jgi:hypothetical protein
MKRILLLLLIGWLLPDQAAQASHAQGGQITYEALGNNRYRLTCSYFRDCQSIAAEGSMVMNCRVGTPVTSCTSNDPRNRTVTLLRSALAPGNRYCSIVPGGSTQCAPGGLSNYELVRYTADVELPPAPAWTLSVEMSARPTLENIGGNTTLRLEATLNNQIMLANGTQQTVQNTSPQYHDQDAPVPVVSWLQRNLLTFSTFEPDGDSLVYSLDRPLEGCNDFSAYGNSPSGTPIIVSANPPCIFTPPPGTVPYSATYPIASYDISGSCGASGGLVTGPPHFEFNPQLGIMSFTPVALFNAPPLDRNQYAVVGKVTEYRKINGQYYLIGSVRRDLLVAVINSGSNQVPSPPTTTAGTPITGVAPLQVTTAAGVYTEADFFFTDPNPANQLTVSVVQPTGSAYGDMHINPSNPAPPVVVLNNGTATPSLKVRLRPDPYLAGRTFHIPVKVEDNACPVKGTQYYVLVLKVQAGSVTATQTPARRLQLSAYPTPFTDEVRFTLPRPRAGAAAVLVFDQVGRLVDRLPVPASAAAEAQLTWTPAAHVPAGVYSARFADGLQTVRLVRVNP